MISRPSPSRQNERAIQRDLIQIERWYRQLQSHFDIHELEDTIGSKLLDRQANVQQPVHSWYVLKEACSYELPIWVVKKLEYEFNFKVSKSLDPFVGCGTTGIVMASMGIDTDGIEYNPFIRFVASTKANSDRVNHSQVTNFIKRIKNSAPKNLRFSWPRLSTFHEPLYFRPSDIHYLLYVLQEIEDRVTCDHSKDLLRLGVAKAIEPVSNLRKDGRALRYVTKKSRPTASEILPAIWEGMLADTKANGKQSGEFRVYLGNAKNLSGISSISSGGYDLILYSPPYLNNFDYSEVYKLELWLLGFVNSYDDWRDLRKLTIRSHHSVKFPETNDLSSGKETKHISEHLDSLADSACLTGYAASTMPQVIRGYFDDMYLSLREQFRVLKPGGFLVYIVANSRHAYLPIATDVILGEIARTVGFEALELNILKKRNGRTRQKNFLRESAVLMQKPPTVETESIVEEESTSAI